MAFPSAGDSVRPGVGGSAGRHTGVGDELSRSGRDLSVGRLNVIRDITSTTPESPERSRGSPLDERRAATTDPSNAPRPAAPKMTVRPPGRNSAAGMAKKSPARKPSAAPKARPNGTLHPTLARTRPILDRTGAASKRAALATRAADAR